MPAEGIAPRDLAIAAVLALVTAASRAPFVRDVLYHWDSINFALALEHFDIRASQPHPPGYLIYVVLGRLVHLLVPEPQQALSAISVVSSGLAVASLYLLGLDLFGRAVGIAAALLLAASPLFWFYGAIALPHSLDAFAVIVAAGLLWRVSRGETRFFVATAVWLAIAGGMRPQTEVFLAPLVLYAYVRGAARAHWPLRTLAFAAIALLVVNLAWLVPLMELSGGVESYRRTTDAFTEKFNSTTSVLRGAGWFGMRRNALKLGMYTAYGGCAALPLLAVGLIRGRCRLRAIAAGEIWIFLLLWMVPSLVFYQLIHMGQQGLVFVFLPALLLASAAVWVPFDRASWALVALAVAIDASLFLFAPAFPLRGDRLKLLTADTLRIHSRAYDSRFAAIRGRFDPSHTVIVSSGWRFPQYYLGSYPLVRYGIISRWELGEGSSSLKDVSEIGPQKLGITPDAGGVRYAVLFDADLNAFVPAATPREWVDLDDGERLMVLRLAAGEGLRLAPDSIGIAAPPGEAAESP